MKIGDIVKTTGQIECSQGPYVFIHEMNEFCILVALDNSFCLNVRIDTLTECGWSIFTTGTGLARKLSSEMPPKEVIYR